MDELTAARYRDEGLERLRLQEKQWKREEDYLRGKHDEPFAPTGVNQEYKALQRQAIANYLPLVVGAPVQRCRPEGFATGRDADADTAAWNEIWQPNKLDARLPIVLTESFAHGRGVMSVSRDPANPKTPKVRVESSRRVWIEPDPDDPFEPLYTVKRIVFTPPASMLWVPTENGAFQAGDIERVYVYDAEDWVQFERRMLGGSWSVKGAGKHDLGMPFVPFDVGLDGDGRPHSALAPLIPQQDAVNTIRFNTLLAMQFSAFRQRVIVGFDPVMRDSDGNPIWQKNADGSIKTDDNGQPIPMLNTIGRAGVDRILAFPGHETKVFDLQESNLDNYVKVLQEFITELFAIGQVPPQYLLNGMANLSGDALTAAESTLAALVEELKRGWGESIEQVMRLANKARGEQAPDVASEVLWGDAEARSFGAIVDGIVKLVNSGFPEEPAWQMLPGATPQKVKGWAAAAERQRDAARRAVLERVTRPVVEE